MIVRYVIEVNFPRNSSEEDLEELLEELVDTTTRYGSDADGAYEIIKD